MTDKYELMMNIYKRAQEYPEGATQKNIFMETVHHVVADKFYGLSKKTEKPSREQLAECLVETAKQVHEKNPKFSEAELNQYLHWLQENAEKFRPLFEKVAKLR